MDRDVADVTQRLPSIPAFIRHSCWKINFNKKDIICQLVIDCQKLVDTGLLPMIDDLIYDIETASKVLCKVTIRKFLIV
jgi:hypothetical protein